MAGRSRIANRYLKLNEEFFVFVLKHLRSRIYMYYPKELGETHVIVIHEGGDVEEVQTDFYPMPDG